MSIPARSYGNSRPLPELLANRSRGNGTASNMSRSRAALAAFTRSRHRTRISPRFLRGAVCGHLSYSRTDREHCDKTTFEAVLGRNNLNSQTDSQVEELRRIRIAAVISLLVALASVHCADAEESVAQGERVYENYWATSHGEQLQNNSSGLTFDLRRLKADDYSRFANSVRNGKNKMPPWKGVLDDAQIDQVWAYIRATSPP